MNQNVIRGGKPESPEEKALRELEILFDGDAEEWAREQAAEKQAEAAAMWLEMHPDHPDAAQVAVALAGRPGRLGRVLKVDGE